MDKNSKNSTPKAWSGNHVKPWKKISDSFPIFSYTNLQILVLCHQFKKKKKNACGKNLLSTQTSPELYICAGWESALWWQDAKCWLIWSISLMRFKLTIEISLVACLWENFLMGWQSGAGPSLMWVTPFPGQRSWTEWKEECDLGPRIHLSLLSSYRCSWESSGTICLISCCHTFPTMSQNKHCLL